MLNKNKYWKSLLGIRAEVLIAKQVDYSGTGASTVADDYESFVDNAAEGEFAFFNYTTNALIAGTTSGSPAAVTAASTSAYLFAAVKRDGQVERTNKFRIDQYSNSRAAYAAPTAQVSTATISGTPVVGHEYHVKIIETTAGHSQFPSWTYNYVAVTGATITTVMAAIAAKINDRTNIINKGTDPIVTASAAAGVLTITADEGGPSFRIAFSAAMIDDLSAVAAYTGGATATPKYGNGTFEQVSELEKYSDVLKGVTTNYPGRGDANPEDFGKPTAFVVDGIQYNIYLLKGEATETSPTPVEKHFAKHTIVLAIPSNGAANPEAEVKGILGL